MSVKCIPFKPHIYVVKPGCTYRGTHIFLIFTLNIDCGYSLEPPHQSISIHFKTFFSIFTALKINVYCLGNLFCNGPIAFDQLNRENGDWLYKEHADARQIFLFIPTTCNTDIFINCNYL